MKSLDILLLCLTVLIPVLSLFVTVHQFRPSCIAYMNMEMNSLTRNIEKRRFVFHALLNIISFFYAIQVFSQGSSLLMGLSTFLSMAILINLLKPLSKKEFEKNFTKKKIIIEDDLTMNQTKYIDKKFSEKLLNQFNRFNFLIDEEMEFDKFKTAVLNKERIFKFKNRFEALDFHDTFFDSNLFPQKEYCKLYGLKESSFKGDKKRNSYKFREDYDNFKHYISNQ